MQSVKILLNIDEIVKLSIFSTSKIQIEEVEDEFKVQEIIIVTLAKERQPRNFHAKERK